MITRPLDLASRLRPEPRNFDWLFFVNAGLVVLFFSVFGSRFVLAPGLGVDFRLPPAGGAPTEARSTTHHISVISAGQIVADDGLRPMTELRDWLQKKARTVEKPSLLIRASTEVSHAVVIEIVNAAREAGFTVLLALDTTDTRKKEGP